MKSTSRSHQLTVTELLELVESSDVKRKRQSFVGAVCFFSVLSATAFFSVFGTKGWKECTEDPHSTEESGKKKQLYLPGIRNFGNNCFLNVILQSLSSCHYMAEFLGEALTSRTETKVQLAFVESLLSILTELAEPIRKSHVVNPKEIIGQISDSIRKFNFLQQQDAVEALSHITHVISREFHLYRQLAHPHWLMSSVLFPGQEPRNFFFPACRKLPLECTLITCMKCADCTHQFDVQVSIANEIVLPVLSLQELFSQVCTLQMCLEKYTKLEMVQEVQCIGCNHLSAIRTVNAILAVRSLPGFEAVQKSSSKIVQSSNICAIKDLLEKLRNCRHNDFCTCPESMNLLGLNWPQSQSTVVRKILLGKVPKILCLQIQRLAFSPFGVTQKSREHVQFPYILDIQKYRFSQLFSHSALSSMQEDVSTASTILQPNSTNLEMGPLDTITPGISEFERDSSLYILRSVVKHLGEAYSGHYVVYRQILEDNDALLDDTSCLVHKPWVAISDETVHVVEISEVFGSEASILFYERLSFHQVET